MHPFQKNMMMAMTWPMQMQMAFWSMAMRSWQASLAMGPMAGGPLEAANAAAAGAAAVAKGTHVPGSRSTGSAYADSDKDAKAVPPGTTDATPA